MRWDAKTLESFVKATSVPLTDREWEVVRRNMKAYYASDGALPIDARCHAWLGPNLLEKDWDAFVAATNEQRELAAKLATKEDEAKSAAEKRRAYHRVYQRRRRWLQRHAADGTVPDVKDMPGAE